MSGARPADRAMAAVCAEVHGMLTAAGLGAEDQAALMESFAGPDRALFEEPSA